MNLCGFNAQLASLGQQGTVRRRNRETCTVVNFVPGMRSLSKLVFRRIALSILAAITPLAALQAAPPPLAPAKVSVPHFGNGKLKTCVPLVRQRIKAVMNGASVGQFEAQPPASNRPCK